MQQINRIKKINQKILANEQINASALKQPTDLDERQLSIIMLLSWGTQCFLTIICSLV